MNPVRQIVLASACLAAAFGAGAAEPVFAGKPVTSERLAGQRGGAAVQDTAIEGRLVDTTARNVTSGDNAIRDGAFTNAAGLNTVIQNSGANVLIQNATTVNVQLR